MVVPTVGVLIIKEGKVLLVRHGKNAGHLTGTYGIPAGKIEEGEEERAIAVKELREESGLVAEQDSLVRLPGEWSAEIRRKGGVKEFFLKVYMADSFEGNLKSEHETEPKWVRIDELSNYNLLPNMKEVIKKGLESQTTH